MIEKIILRNGKFSVEIHGNLSVSPYFLIGFAVILSIIVAVLGIYASRWLLTEAYPILARHRPWEI